MPLRFSISRKKDEDVSPSVRQLREASDNKRGTGSPHLSDLSGDSSLLEIMHREIKHGAQDEDENPASKGPSLLKSTWFQLLIMTLVTLNAIIMGVEADYPEWSITWSVCEHFFTAVFLLEMVVKIYLLGVRGYFEDKGNWLDAFLVLLAVVDTWVITQVGLDVDTQSVSVLRVLRFARLARVVRIFKQFRRFMLILKGIADAMKTTTWVGALVCACIYVCAIFCTDFIGNSNPQAYPGYSIVEQEIDESEIMQNFNPYLCFGSMTRSMLTLFNILILAEWSEVVRPVYQKQPHLVTFFILFALIVTYGVMNVIIGMIVDNIMANARDLEQTNRDAEVNHKLSQLERVKRLVLEMDKHGQGYITLGQLREGMKLGSMREFLHEVKTPTGMTGEELLLMLDDDSDGHLLYDEVVRGFYRLIDSDTFQRHCLFQMGINQVKKLAVVNSEQIMTIMTKIDNLEHNMKELLCHVQMTTPEPTKQRAKAPRRSRSQPPKPGKEDTPSKATECADNSSAYIDGAAVSQHTVYTAKVEDSVVAEGGARLEKRVASALERAQLCGNEQSRAAASLCMPELLKELQLSLESVQCELESRLRQIVGGALESYGVAGQWEERQSSLAGRSSDFMDPAPALVGAAVVETPPVENCSASEADSTWGRMTL